jgi:TolB-like protein/tetratricopeptide (TPR) repeat protein
VLNDSSDKPRYVETIPRRGYRFIAPLPDARPPSVAPAKSEIQTSPGLESRERTAAAPFIAPIPATKSARLFLKLFFAGAVAVIALLTASIAMYRRIHGTEPPPITSLAVLPLKNLSGDPAQEYLTDGMTEELIGRLATLRRVRVISRTSSMHFKDTRLSAPEIAKALGVDALVEGSVIRDGNRMRVHAQLIRGVTDEHFWSKTYDCEISDVLTLESDVAQSIAEHVAATLTGHEHSRMTPAHQISPEVYENYLKGKLSPHNTRPELEQIRAYFEEAIRKDPTFAPAYVGLGRTYEDASPMEMRPKVLSAAKKALQLDPELADAHLLIAQVYQRQWKWKDAEAEYRRALQLKPSDASAHLGFAIWLTCQGRMEEALAWARRARELDPLGDTEAETAWILFNSRHYDEAIRELQTELTVHPDSAVARWSLGLVLIAKGQPQHAIAELERTAAIMHRSPGSLEVLAMAYGYAGRSKDALRVIDELKRFGERGYVPAGAFINPYLGLRDYDRALAGFERAYKEQSNILQWVKVEPIFDPLRGDPRFQDLVRRVGLK